MQKAIKIIESEIEAVGVMIRMVDDNASPNMTEILKAEMRGMVRVLNVLKLLQEDSK